MGNLDGDCSMHDAVYPNLLPSCQPDGLHAEGNGAVSKKQNSVASMSD